MELNQITMDRDEARRAFIEYRNAVRARHSEEDAEIMRGYLALSRGMQLISLRTTMQDAGTVPHQVTRFNTQKRQNETWTARLPALAIARADAMFCDFTARDREGTFHSIRTKKGSGKHAQLAMQLDFVSFSTPPARAMVPNVPPGLRPKAHLSNFWILWDAEWTAVSPTDPALLKHVGGDLYAVLAVWDLTELERRVLMRRFQ